MRTSINGETAGFLPSLEYAASSSLRFIPSTMRLSNLTESSAGIITS
ncbi:MAG: hypothetical protein LBU83_07355 [Bacteroidales bacterium]|nr:hypothetical protein [Bacteroidales bacterium]